MLNRTEIARNARTRRREAKLWDTSQLTPSLGCIGCPNVADCGGLRVLGSMFDCLDNCCGKPSRCSVVCPNKAHDFASRVREVAGFKLDNISRAPVPPLVQLPPVVPVLFHGKARERPFAADAVALSLYRILNKKDGSPKFTSEAELRQEYSLAPATKIILTGTDQDPPLERWWSYGEDRRVQIIQVLRDLGVGLVTAPNYSLFANTPRWDDLHSMKRIGIVQAEFQRAGLPCALHVNGRTDRDFERWIEFVAARPEITHLAYEFATGAGRAERIQRHTEWLGKIARGAGRPLTLIVRSGLEALEALSDVYESVVFLETSSFMKSMNRQLAVPQGNRWVRWEAAPTLPDEKLDDLFERNAETMANVVGQLMAPRIAARRAAA